MITPQIHFSPRMQVLDEEQISKLHHATLEVLERTGVQIIHPRAREILHGAGAHVQGSRVRIPGWLVEDAIARCPERVALGRRNGEISVLLEGNKSWFGPSLDCIDYLDPSTSERRRFTSADCRVTARIADALPNYSWVMTIGMADDAPPGVADRLIAREVLAHCEKPYVFCSDGVDGVRDIYDMAVLIAGSKERFEQAPTVVHFAQPITPLVHHRASVDKLIFCAENRIPLIYYSAPQAGSTSPATLAATVVLGNAESLSGLVLSQQVRPGCAFIYGAYPSIMDMATTVFAYAAPEANLMIAALAQMAQGYRLPFFGAAGCSDAKLPDPQAAAEAAFSCLTSALSGANLVHDCGWLDHGSVASPAYMVLVHEILEMLQHFLHGLPLSDETLALDLIDRVGPGGHFLEERHTLRHFREIWYCKLFDRSVHAQWLAQGARQFEDRLRDQTAKVMQHEPSPLPPETTRELDRMARAWRMDGAEGADSR